MDFKTKSRPCQTISVKSEKNAKFLAINHSLISFEKETYKGGKKIPSIFTILRPVAAGWGSAPYKQNQKTARAFKLSEYSGGNDPYMKFYSFEKVSNNMEKGPRCDDINFELRPGNALKFWLDEKRLEEIAQAPSKHPAWQRSIGPMGVELHPYQRDGILFAAKKRKNHKRMQK